MVDGWRGRPEIGSAGIPAILAATANLHHSRHRTHHHGEGVAGLPAGFQF